MHVLLLFAILQAHPAQGKPPDLTAPQSQSSYTPFKKPISSGPSSGPFISPNPTKTTPPTLNENSTLMTAHEMMERDIGGQEKEITELTHNYLDLKEKREKQDRPDIDDLKTSKRYAAWTASLIGSIIVIISGVFWWAKEFLWKDSIKPRLKRELIEPAEPLV